MVLRYTAHGQIVDRGKRRVFIKSGVDTADQRRWRQLLQMHAIMDEFAVEMSGEHSRVYQAADAHARFRLRRRLCRKHEVPGARTSRLLDEFLYDTLELVRLELRTRNFPWTKA